MKRISILALVLILLMSVSLLASEKLAFISSHDKVPNIYLFDPETGEIDTLTNYPLNGVLAFDMTPDGQFLVSLVHNPVTDGRKLGLKLVTRKYPFNRERIVMTYQAESWEALRNRCHVAVDPQGRYVTCVDTMGTMLVDLAKEEIKYIFSHRKNEGSGLCESYYNWGGEFSPDGKKFCLQSYCIANLQRFDIYNLETREYQNIYELPNLTGFEWLPTSDAILLTGNACGESPGLYIAEQGAPLLSLEVCNLTRAQCNKYLGEFYSNFTLPQVVGDSRFLVRAEGVTYDGEVLDDVYIIDQSEQVITEIVAGDYRELRLSPSGKYMAGVINPNPKAVEGRLFLHNFQTNQSDYIFEGDSTCFEIEWVEFK